MKHPYHRWKKKEGNRQHTCFLHSENWQKLTTQPTREISKHGFTPFLVHNPLRSTRIPNAIILGELLERCLGHQTAHLPLWPCWSDSAWIFLSGQWNWAIFTSSNVSFHDFFPTTHNLCTCRSSSSVLRPKYAKRQYHWNLQKQSKSKTSEWTPKVNQLTIRTDLAPWSNRTIPMIRASFQSPPCTCSFWRLWQSWQWARNQCERNAPRTPCAHRNASSQSLD